MAKHAPIFNSRFAPINVWFVSLKQSYTEYNRGCMTKKKSPLFKVITRELKLEKTWNVFDLCQEKPVKVSHPIDIGKFQRGSQDLQPHMDQWNTRRHQSPQEP